MHQHRSLVLAALLIAPSLFMASQASAQQTPSPQSLNACTAITDPTALRHCLERNAGVDERFVPNGMEKPAGPRPILRDEGAFREEDRSPKPSLLQDRGVIDRDAGPPP